MLITEPVACFPSAAAEHARGRFVFLSWARLGQRRREGLASACPDGVDIDFENIGGVILDAIWPLPNNNARVLVCSLMAQYNLMSPYPGPELTRLLRNAPAALIGMLQGRNFGKAIVKIAS
ncbi:NADPH-dependent curcumin reductase CurA [Bradyrhizobium sp. USDA 376]